MGGLEHQFGGSWRRFGAILGVMVGSGSQMRLGRRLGPSWGCLGSVLEASWAVLGRTRWPTWFQVGSQNEAKIDKKSIQNALNFYMPVGKTIIRFFQDFWNPKPHHVGLKMPSKIYLILERPKRPKLL